MVVGREKEEKEENRVKEKEIMIKYHISVSLGFALNPMLPKFENNGPACALVSVLKIKKSEF